MIIVIDTQDHENYAAHTGFDGTYRWKAKGGSSYKITNVPAGADASEIVDMVRSQIELDDEYFTTAIIGFHVEADDYLSWFERSQLEYDGEIRYPEPTIELGELA
jgi:hypothetical protein